MLDAESMGCISCQGTKALLKCGCCESDVCKYCAHILPEDNFSFLTEVAPELKHEVYCPPCFNLHVSDQWDDYQATMEKAKNINVYLSNQSKETRLIKRIQKPIKVSGCKDHDETLLRLAFQAVKAGFNGLIDVDLVSQKVKIAGYQTQTWSGKGIPVELKGHHIVKDRSIWHNPN